MLITLRTFALLVVTVFSLKAYAVPFALYATTTNGTIAGTIDIDTVAGKATGATLTYTAGSEVRSITTAPVSQGEDPFGSNTVQHLYFMNFTGAGVQFHLAFVASTLVNFQGVSLICAGQQFCLLTARPYVTEDTSTLTLDVGSDQVQSGSLLGTGPSSVTISPGSLIFSLPLTVALSGTPGASIYYTLDGTTPTPASTEYTQPLTITATTTLTAFEQFDFLPAEPSGITSATYTYEPMAPTTLKGFDSTSVTLNGSAVLNGSTLRLTTAGNANQAGSGFYNTPLDVQTFTSDFSFRLTQAAADGFMFVLQTKGPSALGSYGQFLGFGAIPGSVGIKFDLYNNAGEGNNSTGIFLNGTWPTLPTTDLTPSGIDLHSGDLMRAHITYDGTTMVVNILDTVTQRLAVQSYPINLPMVLGSSTAYAGFTGGTGGLTATQDIVGWTYESGAAVPAPILEQTFMAYSSTISASTVALTDGAAGAKIFYTADGSAPTAASTPYTGPINIGGTITINAVAVVNDVVSSIATGTFTSSFPTIFTSNGFQPGSMTLNGSASIVAVDNNTLFLTNDGTNQAGSAFFPTPVNVNSFVTNFTIEFPQVDAYPTQGDGLMFVIQNQGPTALGAYGQFLGFGGITKSVGVKFDIYDNAGEGDDSTGVYINGTWPTRPSFDLTGTNIVLRTPEPISVRITYVNSLLTVTMTQNSRTATQVYAIDIPSIVGGPTAYVGFTGGTGGLTSAGTVGGLNFSAP